VPVTTVGILGWWLLPSAETLESPVVAASEAVAVSGAMVVAVGAVTVGSGVAVAVGSP